MPIKNVEGRAAGIWPSCSTRASLRSSAWSLNDGSTDPPSMAGHRFVSPRKGPHGRPHYMDAVDAGPRSPPPFANGLRFMERTSQQPPHQGAGAVATTERGRFSRRSDHLTRLRHIVVGTRWPASTARRRARPVEHWHVYCDHIESSCSCLLNRDTMRLGPVRHREEARGGKGEQW